MITTFKITIEHFIIVILAVLLFIKSCGTETDCGPDKIETTVEKIVTVSRDSAKNNEIKDFVPEEILIIELPDKIETVIYPEKLSKIDQDKIKPAYKYRDTTYFPGSMVISNIISEGRILETSFVLEVENISTTVTTTKTIVKQPGGLFISPGLDYSPIGGIEAIETSLTYIKGDLGLSIGGYYNFSAPKESLGAKFKIHIKL